MKDQKQALEADAGIFESSSFRRYILYVAGAILVFMALHAGISVVLDPFRVFGLTAFNQRNFEPNTRYAKIEYLKRNQFQGFVFGSSRVNAYRTELISRLTGLRFYNFSVPSEMPFSMYHKLRWLIDNGQPVKSLVIGLGFDQFEQDAEISKASLGVYREHPEVMGNSRLPFLASYLLMDPRLLSVAVYGNWFKKDTWYRFDVNTGHYYFPFYDRLMDEDPDGFFRARFHTDLQKRSRIPKNEQFQYLEKTIALAIKNGIETHVIINPLHRWTFLSFFADEYVTWLRRVVAITGPLWDFSGLNSITNDDFLFYGVGHSTFQVGDLALMRLFDPDNRALSAHPGYGVRVTPETLNQRAATLKASLARRAGGTTRKRVRTQQ
tara:strand:- start:271 stop:1410 length:1140 start_codon:yes stop_codon:yes gene_type:complete